MLINNFPCFIFVPRNFSSDQEKKKKKKREREREGEREKDANSLWSGSAWFCD